MIPISCTQCHVLTNLVTCIYVITFYYIIFVRIKKVSNCFKNLIYIIADRTHKGCKFLGNLPSSLDSALLETLNLGKGRVVPHSYTSVSAPFEVPSNMAQSSSRIFPGSIRVKSKPGFVAARAAVSPDVG